MEVIDLKKISDPITHGCAGNNSQASVREGMINAGAAAASCVASMGRQHLLGCIILKDGF